MDSSKPGKGILASLEHREAAQPARVASADVRGPAAVAGAGLLLAAVLAWWIYSGPSPLHPQEPLPRAAMPELAIPPVPSHALAPDVAAAAIIDEAPPPPLQSTAVAAALSPAPIATVVIRRERSAAAKPPVKPARRDAAPRPVKPGVPASTADSDVALLTALVAHANDSDIIEPRLVDSTVSLLQRCRRVGGEEGRLCRVRICAARAGDDACHTD